MFRSRNDAGQKLAEALRVLPEVSEPGPLLVLAIPRGGVPIGAVIARQLHAPLDVWLAHKLGAPGNPEFAIGSVSVHGERYLDRAAIDLLGIASSYIEEETRRQNAELARRMKLFRGHAEPVSVAGKTVILVDDGIATGATVLSAIASLRRAGAKRLILAAPVAPRETVAQLRAAADKTLILETPYGFASVGQFYETFEQVPDEEVVRLLAESRQP